jgi:hypothetical protein
MFLITLTVIGALILMYDYKGARLLSVVMDVSVSCVSLYRYMFLFHLAILLSNGSGHC